MGQLTKDVIEITYRPRSGYTHRMQRIRYLIRLIKLLFSRQVILIYQMGKVGSQSIYLSLLARRDVDIPVMHIHRLNVRRMGDTYPLGDPRNYRLNGVLGRMTWAVIKFKLKYQKRTTWHIITLTRDPIGRNVSAFFQNIFNFANGTESVDEIIDVYNSKYNKRVPFDWFEVELKEMFGMDAYRSGFPREQGYQILEKGPVRVLILKLERLNEFGEEVIKEFLGLESFSLDEHNVGEDKTYRDLYSQFKEHYRCRSAELEEAYSSEYARCFYNETELARFRKKWGGD